MKPATWPVSTARTKPAVWPARELWLRRCADALVRGPFQRIGFPRLAPYRLSVGFPAGGQRSKSIGECHSADSSKAGVCEIFVHPKLDDALEVAGVVAHELAHVAVGLSAKHGRRFEVAVRGLGLDGPPTATVPGASFAREVKPILRVLGKYPHKALDGGLSSGRPKQAARLIKAQCGDCGYTVRVTRLWIAVGVPCCPNPGCGQYETEMDVETDEGGER